MPDVKIRGYSAEFTYKDVPMLWLADPSQEIGEPEEGETPNLVPFTYGQAVPKTVTPDFSGGDMSVPIPEGELVNQLTITKPAELIPENIPEGMYIAGVGPGTFAGGGDDGDRINGAWANLKYIIPVQVYVDITNSGRAPFFGGTYNGSTITLNGVSVKRSAVTEQINMVLFPPQASVADSTGYNNGSIVWSHQIDRNNQNYMITTCTFIISKNTGGTISTQQYTTKGDSSLVSSIAKLTRQPYSGFFSTGAEEMVGWWRGFILVHDSAHSGPPEILKTNTYVTGYRINVIE